MKVGEMLGVATHHHITLDINKSNALSLAHIRATASDSAMRQIQDTLTQTAMLCDTAIVPRCGLGAAEAVNECWQAGGKWCVR